MPRNWAAASYIGSMREYLAFETFRRSKRPNNYLVAPDGLCEHAEPDQVSPVLAVSPEITFGRLVAQIEAEKLWVKLNADPSALRLSFVAVTPLLRFRDDVDIRILEGSTAEESQVAVYSRSRLGHSDLGANAKRVRSLLAQLTAK